MNPFSIIKKLLNFLLNRITFYRHNVKIGGDWRINGRLFITNSGRIVIGKSFHANSGKNTNPIGGDTVLRLIVGSGAELVIGNNVGISNSTIVCRNNVEIGNFVLIGGSCKIWDTDFHSLDPILRMHKGDNNVKTEPIKIGDYTFIGGNSIILKGVTIGNNSIVGAGSVVTKSIPDNEIWAGNPARFIKAID